MRFTTEQEGLDYLRSKQIPEARWMIGRIAPKAKSAPKVMRPTVALMEREFDDWLQAKRAMFSPEEFAILTEKQGVLGRAISVLQGKPTRKAMRDHWVNVFVDWCEMRKRKRVIIVVPYNYLEVARGIAKEVDKIGGDKAFSVKLSESGEAPATYYACSWNCAASEYDHFIRNISDWFIVHDGDVMSFNDVIQSMNLKHIEEGENGP